MTVADERNGYAAAVDVSTAALVITPPRGWVVLAWQELWRIVSCSIS
jgi:hypothetical protein